MVIKRIIVLLLACLCIASSAHAAFAGFLMEDGVSYVLMETSGYVLQETSTASSPGGGTSPAMLLIILDD